MKKRQKKRVKEFVVSSVIFAAFLLFILGVAWYFLILPGELACKNACNESYAFKSDGSINFPLFKCETRNAQESIGEELQCDSDNWCEFHFVRVYTCIERESLMEESG